jgi:nitrogen fixation NifU-like protein
MDRQAAIEVILDHYQSPRHRGELVDADVVMPGGNPGCGDVVIIYLKVDRENDRIAELTFEGEGCTISQAAASILTESVADFPLSDVEEMDYQEWMDVIGRDVAQSRPRCATLALGTLKTAIRKFRSDRLREENGLPPAPDATPMRFEA